VGLGKARFMRREHGAALDVMLAVKRALDPLGILNPGKIFPVEA
jgi:D-lactate dehydrogenase (cytochrome)